MNLAGICWKASYWQNMELSIDMYVEQVPINKLVKRNKSSKTEY